MAYKKIHNCLICNGLYNNYKFKRYCSFKCWENRKIKGNGSIIVTCDFCNEKTLKHKSAVQKNGKYCDVKCFGKHQAILKMPTDLIEIKCVYCKIIFKRRKPLTFKIFTKDTPKNNFCSRKCSDIFRKENSVFKTKRFIVKRSNMEEYLSKKINLSFPFIIVLQNDRKILSGLELDLYLPSLNLAFEINGKRHYEPIEGEESLKNTKRNDSVKCKICKNKKIRLVVIKYIEKFYIPNVEKIWKEIVKPEILKLVPFCEPEKEEILNFVKLPLLIKLKTFNFLPTTNSL